MNGFIWENSTKIFGLEIRVEWEHLGPPVFSRVSIGNLMLGNGDRPYGDIFECSFYTNLSWVTSFSYDMKKIK